MNRPGTSVNKFTNKSNLKTQQRNKEEFVFPKFSEFLEKRDYVGCLVSLELDQEMEKTEIILWQAYCHFHNGNYKKSINLYDILMRKGDYDKNLHIYKACCYFALMNYEEAKTESLKGPSNELQNRLLYQISYRQNDENSLMQYHH